MNTEQDDPQNQPLVLIVLLNWNNTNLTLDCLSSLSKLNYPNYRICVVDNGSYENPAKILESHSSEAHIISSNKNLGYTGGNNLAIKYGLELGADYIWLLNNDTIVEPDSLTPLVECMENNLRAGIIGSKIYFYDSPLIWSAGGEIKSLQGRVIHRCAFKSDGECKNEKIREVGFIPGCSALLRSSVIEEIGVLDDQFFAYWEDVDLSYRAQLRGWQLLYNPHSIIYHRVQSRKQYWFKPHVIYYNTRNRLLFAQKHFKGHLIFPFIVWALLWLTFQMAKALLHLDIKYFVSIIKLSFQGFRDFVLHRYGEKK